MNYQQLAAAIYEACETLGIDAQIAAAMPATWQHGLQCITSGDPLVGYRLLLYALAQTPDGAQALIEGLQAALAGHHA